MYIAIDVGGTKTLVAAYSEDGQVLRSEKHPTDANFDKFMQATIVAVEAIAQGERIDAIGVASPALIDHATGVSKSFGNLDWKNVDIVSPLKEAFVDAVFIDNDAKLGALGEANMGAGQGHEKMLYLTLSTGIGVGVTINGKISEVLHDIEGGMMTFRHDGKLMIWEKFASGKAFYEEFGMRGEDDNNPDDWKEWAEDVSIGLINLISLIQPDIVVIGGSMGNHISKYHDFLQASVQAKRGATVEMPVIVGAKYPDDAVINGCYVLCKQHNQN